jgi:hypothetical protein
MVGRHGLERRVLWRQSDHGHRRSRRLLTVQIGHGVGVGSVIAMDELWRYVGPPASTLLDLAEQEPRSAKNLRPSLIESGPAHRTAAASGRGSGVAAAGEPTRRARLARPRSPPGRATGPPAPLACASRQPDKADRRSPPLLGSREPSSPTAGPRTPACGWPVQPLTLSAAPRGPRGSKSLVPQWHPGGPTPTRWRARNHEATKPPICRRSVRVSDGTRTRDRRDHNGFRGYLLNCD